MSSTDRSHEFEFLRQRLNPRFLVWSLAVAGSLSTSALVNLPAPVWAQEADTSASESADEQSEEDAPLTRAVFSELLRSQKIDELTKRIDTALTKNPLDPNLVSMNTSLAMSQLRSARDKAVERLRSQVERLLNESELSTSLLNFLATNASYLTQYDRDMDTEQKLSLFDTVIERIKSSPSAEQLLRGPINMKSRLLISEDRADEAKAMLDELLTSLREAAEQGDAAALVSFAPTYFSNLSNQFPDAAQAVVDEAETFALQDLKGDDLKAAALGRLINLKSGIVSSLTYADPAKADEILAQLESTIEDVKERLAEGEEQRLSVYERQIRSLRGRVGPALERMKLIGTEAPDFQADAFVAMPETSMDELKGKVVLLDFWAVWCGPCIATFPHLIEWHEEYSEKGLVIIGATRYYNYKWDEDAGKASRASDGVDRETELSMLEKFRESYELKHGFVVSGQDSDFSKQYKVSGIPQAVLIDQEGKIAMIRVGSGEANATALEEKIQELLGQ